MPAVLSATLSPEYDSNKASNTGVMEMDRQTTCCTDADASSSRPMSEERELVERVTKRLVDYFEEIRTEGAKTVTLKSPDELMKTYSDAGVSLSLSDGLPHTNDDLAKAVDLTLENSVRTDAPAFHNQLYGRSEAPGLCGQFVSSSVGGATHTFEVAPVFTVMERECLSKMMSVANFPSNSDGLFVPGGSMGNMYSIHLARWKKFGDRIKKEGVYGMKPLCIFVSAHAHYSYLKSMSFLGLGTDNCIKVAVDKKGSMIPEALVAAIEKAKQDGKQPFLVGCTAGSTVFGGYDDFVAFRKIADENDLWMHIDGCWGAPALLSKKPEINSMMEGFDQADSFTWNPHKFMSVPMQCSVFITRHEDILRKCNAANAAYLFQKDKENTEYDMGDKTVICGRNPDACKLWFAWKMTGDAGWSARVDKAIDLTHHMSTYAQKARFNGRFQLVLDTNFTNFCFWYLPPSLKHLNPEKLENGSDDWNSVHKVAAEIKKTMQQRGLAMIGFQSIPLDKTQAEAFPNFFRMVIAGCAVLTEQGLEKTLHDIDEIGCELFNDEGREENKENHVN